MFSCDICSKVLSRKCSLNRHTLEVHGENKLTCEVCGVSFTRRGKLQRHSRCHLVAPSPPQQKPEANEPLVVYELRQPSENFLTNNVKESALQNAIDHSINSSMSKYTGMNESQKLIRKREAIRRLTKNLFEKIDEDLCKGNPVELELCLEKLADKEMSLKGLNLLVEKFCTDKDVFDKEIARSEEWNENLIDYRVKITQKLKTSPSNYESTVYQSLSSSPFPPNVTPTNDFFESCDIKPRPYSDQGFRKNNPSAIRENHEKGAVEDKSLKCELQLPKPAYGGKSSTTTSVISDENIKKKVTSGRKTTRCKDCQIDVEHFLKHRLLVHNDAKPYACTFCHFASSKKSYLKSHMGVHTGEKSLQCGICGIKFRFDSQLYKHSKTHVNQALYKCNSCEKRFCRKGNLCIHIQKIHGGIKSESGKSLTAKRGTIYRNKQRKLNTSIDARMATSRKVSLVKTEKPNEVDSDGFTFTCEDCGDSFQKAKEFVDHYAERHSTSSKRFVCPICHIYIKTKLGFLIHLRSHINETPFFCHSCNKSYKYYSILKNHERIVHGGNKSLSTGNKKYFCNSCDKSYKHKLLLNNHVRTVHSGKNSVSPDNKKYSCNSCDKSYKHRSHLNSHKRTVHSGTKLLGPSNKKHSCNSCDKSYKHRSHLNSHERTVHSGTKLLGPNNKKHSCNSCDKSYKHRSHLNRHERTVHSGTKSLGPSSKKHSCNSCEKSFEKKQLLTDHKRLHGLKKPNTCLVCFRSFANKFGLLSHSRVHTKKQRIQCHVPLKRFKKRSALVQHLRLKIHDKEMLSNMKETGLESAPNLKAIVEEGSSSILNGAVEKAKGHAPVFHNLSTLGQYLEGISK